MISAGGTGGGVYPALAVVEALDKDFDVLWVGGIGGMEADLVDRAGLKFEAIPAAGLHGVGLKNLPGNMVKLMKGVLAARKILRQYKPDVLFFTGGYVGIPVALAGHRVASLAYVPDIEPGLALKWISRICTRTAVTAPDSRPFFNDQDRVVETGYPVRQNLQQDREDARRVLGLEGNRPAVLVFGGSRGARSINEALWCALPELLLKTQIVHITGNLDWPRVADIQSSLGDLREGYFPFAYLHERMPAALSAADLVVSRAGASILGEFTTLALPSILVPYPHAWRYQKVNAEYLVRQGAAIQIEDELLQAKLSSVILELLGDVSKLSAMSAAARSLSRPEAAGQIAAELRNLAERGTVHG